MNREQYDALILEAQDVTTPSARLSALMNECLTMRQNFPIWNGMVENMWNNGATLGRTLARNPNADNATLSQLADFYPGDVLANPVLPLNILTNDWQGWKRGSMDYLRNHALVYGHDYFPALTQICLSAWRKHDLKFIRAIGGKEDSCGGYYCARCNPQRMPRAMKDWQTEREAVNA